MIHTRDPEQVEPPRKRYPGLVAPVWADVPSTTQEITLLFPENIDPAVLETQTFPAWRIARLPQPKDKSSKDSAGDIWNRWLHRDNTRFFIPCVDAWEFEPTWLEKLYCAMLGNPGTPWLGSFVVTKGPEDSAPEFRNTGFEAGDAFLRHSLTTSPVIIRHRVWRELGGFKSGLSPAETLWDFWLRAARQGLWGSTLPEYLAWGNPEPRTEPSAAMETALGEAREFFRRRPFPFCPKPGESEGTHQPWTSPDIPPRIRPAYANEVCLLANGDLCLGRRMELLSILKQFKSLGWNATVMLSGPSSPDPLADWSELTHEVYALGNLVSPRDYPTLIQYLLRTRRPNVLMVHEAPGILELIPWIRSWFPQLPIAGLPDDSRDGSSSADWLSICNQTWSLRSGKTTHGESHLRLQDLPEPNRYPALSAPNSDSLPDQPIIFLHEHGGAPPFDLDTWDLLSRVLPGIRWTIASTDDSLLTPIRNHPAIAGKTVVRSAREWTELLKRSNLCWIPYPGAQDISLLEKSGAWTGIFCLPDSPVWEQLSQRQHHQHLAPGEGLDPIRQIRHGLLPLLRKPESFHLLRRRKASAPVQPPHGVSLARVLDRLALTVGSGGEAALPPRLGNLWLSLVNQLSVREQEVADQQRRIEELRHSLDRHEIDLRTRLYFSQEGEEFQERLTINRTIQPGKFYKLKFTLANHRGITGLRLDPVDFPAIVTIDSILLYRELTLTPVWNSHAFPRFKDLQLEGTGVLLERNPQWRIFAYGPDPQILFPWQPEWSTYGDLALEVRLSAQLDWSELLPLLRLPDDTMVPDQPVAPTPPPES